MENIYSLGEKYSRINDAYEALKNNLEAKYEENGGEVTEETLQLESEMQELAVLKEEITNDVLSAPDEYAAIVKNAEANKKILEAELKALKEEQAKACAKIEARINRLDGKIDWFKANISDAMKLAEIEKIGGAKTPNKFTIWFKKSVSVEVDEDTALKPYEKKVEDFLRSLPSWISVKTGINKTELKKNLEDEKAEHPATALLSEKKTLQIK